MYTSGGWIDMTLLFYLFLLRQLLQPLTDNMVFVQLCFNLWQNKSEGCTFPAHPSPRVHYFAGIKKKYPTFSLLSCLSVLCSPFFCRCRPLCVFLSWSNSLSSASSWFISSLSKVWIWFLRHSKVDLRSSFRRCLWYSEMLKHTIKKRQVGRINEIFLLVLNRAVN